MEDMRSENIRDIGSRLELFIDNWLIEKMNNTTLKLHTPEKRGIVNVFEKPWEHKAGYVVVFKDGNVFKMYYSGRDNLKRSPGMDGLEPDMVGRDYTCYAESKDGICWEKPSLGIIERNGSKDNNIVWTDTGTPYYYSQSSMFTPFKDKNPDALPSEQYKAFAGQPIYALASPDGFHWHLMQEDGVICDGALDSDNLAFWDTNSKEYRAFIRDKKPPSETKTNNHWFRDSETGDYKREGDDHGNRTIRIATSKDFIHWSYPEFIDLGNSPPEQLYTSQVEQYFRAPHIYVSFPMRFIIGRAVKDLRETEGVFMTSRDGFHFDRIFMEAFVRPGLVQKNWDYGGMASWGILPTAPHEISLYYMEKDEEDNKSLRRHVLRTDGFVSVHASYSDGEFITHPLTFTGNCLSINYSTSIVGGIRVEIQDKGGQPQDGFSLKECTDIYGDAIEQTVTWEKGPDVSRFAGKPIKLKFSIKDADLYSVQFKKSD